MGALGSRMPTAEPAGLAKLKASPEKKIVDLATSVEAAMTWPNKPGDNTPPLKPLTGFRYAQEHAHLEQLLAIDFPACARRTKAFNFMTSRKCFRG